MRQDIMTAAQLQIFAEIGLALFVLAFIIIVAQAFLMSKDRVGHMEHMPLEDGTISDHEEEQS